MTSQSQWVVNIDFDWKFYVAFCFVWLCYVFVFVFCCEHPCFILFCFLFFCEMCVCLHIVLHFDLILNDNEWSFWARIGVQDVFCFLFFLLFFLLKIQIICFVFVNFGNGFNLLGVGKNVTEIDVLFASKFNAKKMMIVSLLLFLTCIILWRFYFTTLPVYEFDSNHSYYQRL